MPTNTFPDISSLLTDREAAELIGMKPDTIRQYQHKGLIGFVKIGGRTRYKKAEIQALVREVPATAAAKRTKK